jgi:hypothetical protein
MGHTTVEQDIVIAIINRTPLCGHRAGLKFTTGTGRITLNAQSELETLWSDGESYFV